MTEQEAMEQGEQKGQLQTKLAELSIKIHEHVKGQKPRME